MLRQATTLTVSGSQTNAKQISLSAQQAGRTIRIIGATITATSSTATTVQFTDYVTTDAISSAYEIPGSGSVGIPMTDNGHGDTGPGNALGVTIGAGAVSIDLVYQLGSAATYPTATP